MSWSFDSNILKPAPIQEVFERSVVILIPTFTNAHFDPSLLRWIKSNEIMSVHKWLNMQEVDRVWLPLRISEVMFQIAFACVDDIWINYFIYLDYTLLLDYLRI